MFYTRTLTYKKIIPLCPRIAQIFYHSVQLLRHRVTLYDKERYVGIKDRFVLDQFVLKHYEITSVRILKAYTGHWRDSIGQAAKNSLLGFFSGYSYAIRD